MNCCSDSQPVFKTGGPFSVAIWLHDTDASLSLPADDPARGLLIDDDVVVTCRVNDRFGRLIADLTVTPYPDQTVNRGWVTLSAFDTSQWAAGEALTDIRVTMGDASIVSETFAFMIERSQTP